MEMLATTDYLKMDYQVTPVFVQSGLSGCCIALAIDFLPFLFCKHQVIN